MAVLHEIRTDRLWRFVRLAVVASMGLAASTIVVQAYFDPGLRSDAHAYWSARGDLYDRAMVGGPDAYLYSPVFAQVLAPLQALSWDAFQIVWAAINAAALVLVAGPFSLPMLLLLPVRIETYALNIHLLIALAVVVGFRWPAAWSLILLTKVTPGIGLLWFAFRHEWRSLAIALGATAAIVALSFVAAPDLWADWIASLGARQDPATIAEWGYAVPLVPRLVLAVILVAWGARTNRQWMVPVAVTLALPVVWIAGLSVLLAMIPLARRQATFRK